jgi:hypothetical protein
MTRNPRSAGRRDPVVSVHTRRDPIPAHARTSPWLRASLLGLAAVPVAFGLLVLWAASQLGEAFEDVPFDDDEPDYQYVLLQCGGDS